MELAFIEIVFGFIILVLLGSIVIFTNKISELHGEFDFLKDMYRSISRSQGELNESMTKNLDSICDIVSKLTDNTDKLDKELKDIESLVEVVGSEVNKIEKRQTELEESLAKADIPKQIADLQNRVEFLERELTDRNNEITEEEATLFSSEEEGEIVT